MKTGSNLCRLVRALRRCARGAAAIEMAFAAPILFLALAGVVEIAMVSFTITLMEGGLREASRYGITGTVPPDTTREERILELIAENTIGLIDMSTAQITYKVYPSFGDVGKPEPYVDENDNGSFDVGEPYTDVNGNGEWDADMGAAGLGGPGDIVLYTITADWNLLTPLIAPLMGEDGVLQLRSSIAVRNEPYPAPEA